MLLDTQVIDNICTINDWFCLVSLKRVSEEMASSLSQIHIRTAHSLNFTSIIPVFIFVIFVNFYYNSVSLVSVVYF